VLQVSHSKEGSECACTDKTFYSQGVSCVVGEFLTERQVVKLLFAGRNLGFNKSTWIATKPSGYPG
jgi:hypothetical protein